MAELGRVVVRADASPHLGLGHVARALAVAHELVATGCSVTICGSDIPRELVGELPVAPSGSVVPGGAADAEIVIGLRPDLVLVDGYHFTADFFATLADNDVPYAVVDDNGDTPARRPVAVVNQNPHAHPAMYEHLLGEPLVMSGVGFAMLRREITEVVRREPAHEHGRLFVAFGGSDPLGLTAPVATHLASRGRAVRVAIGPAHPRRQSLVAELEATAGVTVTDPGEYATELAAAGTAILAAGSSLLEAAFVGTPVIAVIVAENQQRLANAALHQGMAREVLIADQRLLDELDIALDTLDAGPVVERSPIDGNGARRVADALFSLTREHVRLRPASAADAEFLFALRTDAEVRRRSFGRSPSWEQHLHWLRATLNDPDRRLLVVESGACAVGHVRLDAGVDHDVVSLAIAGPARGRGIASRALGAVTAFAGRDLVAHVKPDNTRSVEVFARAGFVVETTSHDEIVMRWTADR